MPTGSEPLVRQWYRRMDTGQEFVVIDVDEGAGVVEVQHFDGDLGQIDLSVWPGLDVELIEPPEDWTGPVDDIERDDLGYTETDMSGEDWQSRSTGGTRQHETWQRPESEEQNDWGEGYPQEEHWEEE